MRKTLKTRSKIHRSILLFPVLWACATIIVGVVGLMVFTDEGRPFSSVEVQFADKTGNGLSIVPASCPSSPHYAGQCSGGGGGSGGGSCPSGTTFSNGECVSSVCSPTMFCSGKNLYRRDPIGSQPNARPDSEGGPIGGGSSGAPLCAARFVQRCAYACSNGACVNQCSAGYFCSGSTLMYRNSSCSTSAIQNCSFGCSSGACIVPPPPTATLNVKPLLLRSGERTTLTWTSENASSCSLRGDNGDSWSGLSGNVQSSAIVGRTVYALRCVGRDDRDVATKSATVNIIPVFEER